MLLEVDWRGIWSPDLYSIHQRTPSYTYPGSHADGLEICTRLTNPMQAAGDKLQEQRAHSQAMIPCAGTDADLAQKFRACTR
jgi:hypothetical protein